MAAMVVIARWFLTEIHESREAFTTALAEEREAFLSALAKIGAEAQKANDDITAQCALHITATRELRESIERASLSYRAAGWDSHQPG